MNKKILLLFTAIIFMMSTSNVSASEGCGVYTEEDLAFYESLNRPDIYDLSCSNGTPFTNEYLETLNEVKKIVIDNNNPYKGLIILCIDLAIRNIELNDYKSAAEEINFIHNFPIKDDLRSWDSDHFFNIELLGYIEKTQDSLKLRKVIKEIAKFC